MEKKDITVVGGGITGLAIAYIAAKNGKSVRVVEASKNFGGLLNTFYIGGNHLEYYYHHFFTHDAELNWLIKELGISDQLEFHETTMGVFRNGKIFDFNSPFDLLKFSPISFIDKIRFGLTSLYLGKVAQWEKFEGVSSMDWLYKWAGKGTTNSLWKPLLDIKFGPHAEKVPLAWMIGRLRQRMNSRKKGDEKLGYLKGSLKTLLDALLEKLVEMGVELVGEAPVTELLIEGKKLKGIETPKGKIEGGEFVMTIPTIYLSPLLGAASKLKAQLEEIKYFGAVCTILELDRSLSPIYWLNVSDEGFPFGGIIEHTNFISPENYEGKHLVYLSRYFDMEEDLAQMSVEEIGKIMVAPLSKIYPDFKESEIKQLHVFKTKTAATVCDLNFSGKVPSNKTEIEGLYLANMAHIYPDERSANNSVRVAAEACQAMGLDASFVPANASLAGKIGFE
ncbi:NAD(P)/FAD-dependent oxidoreductase [Flammeovirgaceae bacterium SG7u.111]|nr:NAD(P)/FAD-dependent oxidoreductase [Flammeovirgaceae bacterium SG7u.132]WPO38167.1 NAD(P)/FAD-dependent oxidoreductase [Flammeovirgaceae bacterium SG7u.111]